jgi:hypothetical protein
MYKRNPTLSDADRADNSAFNERFITQFGLADSIVHASELHGPDWSSKGFNSFQTVYLKNIDRLMSMLPLDNSSLTNYSLLDIGGGNSISTIYFAHSYNFGSFISVEIDSELIAQALANVSNYNLSAIPPNNIKIDMVHSDISCLHLSDTQHVLFMFNSVTWPPLSKFISLNHELLAKNSSFILLANDHCVNDLAPYCELVARDDYYNLSCLRFV